MSCLGSVFSFRGERLRSLPLAAEPFLAIESTLTAEGSLRVLSRAASFRDAAKSLVKGDICG